MRQAPAFERMLVDDGVDLIKFWFSVSQGEQRTRFTIRQVDPVRQWKLSPMDLASLDRWDDYTAAKVAMFRETDTEQAPWTVVKSNDKKRARVEAMRSVLARFDYTGKDDEVVGKPRPEHRGRGGEPAGGGRGRHGPRLLTPAPTRSSRSQSCAGRSLRRWSARLSASSTTRRRWPSRSE